MYCKNCGNVIPDGVAFCGSCGAAAPAAPAAPVTPAEPYAPPAGGYTPPVNPGYTPPVNPGNVPPAGGYTPPVNPGNVPPAGGYTGAVQGQVEDPGQKLGTISLILGIVGLAVGSICSCLFACLGGILPLAAAIVGIVLGKQAQDKSAAAGFENKRAKIGMILSIVATAIIVVFIIINAIAGGVMASEIF